MRIRTYRPGDIPTLLQVQHLAAAFDGLAPLSEADFALLLARSHKRSGDNVFLLTDDDDELNTWGQGETLDGLQGEVVGYTILQLSMSEQAYHFRCHGTVLPDYRGQGAGHGLLLCALNHARIQSLDFAAEARRQQMPIYFEVPLPAEATASAHLARNLELENTGALVGTRFLLYRTEL